MYIYIYTRLYRIYMYMESNVQYVLYCTGTNDTIMTGPNAAAQSITK